MVYINIYASVWTFINFIDDKHSGMPAISDPKLYDGSTICINIQKCSLFMNSSDGFTKLERFDLNFVSELSLIAILNYQVPQKLTFRNLKNKLKKKNERKSTNAYDIGMDTLPVLQQRLWSNRT